MRFLPLIKRVNSIRNYFHVSIIFLETFKNNFNSVYKVVTTVLTKRIVVLLLSNIANL